MLENRSFDHTFGFHDGINGRTGNKFNLFNPAQPQSDLNPAFVVDNKAPYAVLAGKGPGHSIHAMNYKLCIDKAGPRIGLLATNNGFMRSYKGELQADHIPHPSSEIIKVPRKSYWTKI